MMHCLGVIVGVGGCLEPHMSKYDVIVFSCIVGYKLRLRVSGYILHPTQGTPRNSTESKTSDPLGYSD